nr:MAG TPA: hypothetical protein [Caudoviricetes sp.]
MSKLHQKLTLIMQFLLVEHYLQIWLLAEFVMIQMVIYLAHLVIIVEHLGSIILVTMVRKTHVLELAENVYY